MAVSTHSFEFRNDLSLFVCGTHTYDILLLDISVVLSPYSVLS